MATRKKKTTGAARPAATKRKPKTPEFKCPECGRVFSRAAALGAHRRSHGVIGATAKGRARGAVRPIRLAGAAGLANSSRRQTNVGTAVDRDSLLASLFPQGVPPRGEVIRAANQWLDEAERIAHMN
jgi:hypothetical protein